MLSNSKYFCTLVAACLQNHSFSTFLKATFWMLIIFVLPVYADDIFNTPYDFCKSHFLNVIIFGILVYTNTIFGVSYVFYHL